MLGFAVNLREFHIPALIGHCTASGKMDLLAGLWRLVRSLHRLRLTFLNSLFPALHADMLLALVQPLFRVRVSRQFA